MGLEGQSQLVPSNVDHNIAALLFKGPDDREALVFGRRMAEHQGIALIVIRFLPGTEFNHTLVNLTPLPAHERETQQQYKFSTAEMNRKHENILDEDALVPITKKTHSSDGSDAGKPIVYEEQVISNTVHSVLAIAKNNKYDPFLVGMGHFPPPLVADLADQTADYLELGPIGDLLASPTIRIIASILVIQQHDDIHTDEAPFSKNVDLTNVVNI